MERQKTILTANNQVLGEVNIKRGYLPRRYSIPNTFCHSADLIIYDFLENGIWIPTGKGGQTFYSLLVTRYFLLVTCYFLLVNRYYLLVTRYFLLVTTYSLLFTTFSLLFTRYSLLFTCYLLLFVTYSLIFTLLFIRHY